MPWSTKDGGRYYIRRRKCFGRVILKNMGTGIKGEQAAAEDAARRLKEQADKQALCDEQACWETTQTALTNLTSVTDFLTHTALVMSGYFKHGGEWRRNTHVGTTNQIRADEPGRAGQAASTGPPG